MRYIVNVAPRYEDVVCPVLIGEAPGKSTSAVQPIVSSRSGRRLADLLEINVKELAHRATLANLVDEYPGRAYPREQARHEALAVLEGDRVDHHLTSTLLLLGREVARAFALPERLVKGGYFQPHVARGPRSGLEWTCVVLPHPSGLSRWWNDARNAALAKEQLRRLLPSLEPVRLCLDCEEPQWAEYEVVDEVWARATRAEKTTHGVLCPGCLERRVQRLLTREDFTSSPVNAMLRLGIEIGERA